MNPTVKVVMWLKDRALLAETPRFNSWHLQLKMIRSQCERPLTETLENHIQPKQTMILQDRLLV